MTERTYEIDECLGEVGAYGAFKKNSNYYAIGEMSCPIEMCRFKGRVQGESQDSLDDAANNLLKNAVLEVVDKCRAFEEYRSGPDYNEDENPPDFLTPAFLEDII
jgi:hypothetical protein